MVILIILLIGISIFLLWAIVVSFLTRKRIKKAFSEGNVFVFGAKGKGKDVLFQKMINDRRKPYFANLDYGGDFTEIDPHTDLSVAPNTYEDFIEGKIATIKKNDKMEGVDIYLSDGGVYFPSQMDSLLHKKYPSFPIFYAINRHLYNNGIHINCQNLERVWKALREQSDYYILCRRCFKWFPFFIILHTTEYEKYQSALNRLAPMKSTLFNKYSKAEKDLFKATHGFIKNGFIIIPKWTLKYDSRAFHKKLFGYKYTKAKKTQPPLNIQSDKTSTS